jgi:hypothetical protein
LQGPVLPKGGRRLEGRRTFTAAIIAAVFGMMGVTGQAAAAEDVEVAALAREVRGKGWVVFGARSHRGDWDLFLMRPDGSARRNITNTPNATEAAPRFSPDGRRMLYRRLPRGSIISHDYWGFQGRLVIANADGSHPVIIGGKGEYPWACWGPEGKRLACLSKRGIEIIDLATKQTLRTMRRKGLYQQLFWSPDGKWFCGVANHLGNMWTVARMNAATGKINPITHRFACTPDFLPDSQQIIFSHNPTYMKPDKGRTWTQLWMADGDGSNKRLVYGEDQRHVYGGATSPDGMYVLFSISVIDGGLSEWKGAPMALMRLADTPRISGPSNITRKLFPKTKDGPMLKLPVGWEPHWTFVEIDVEQ